MISCENELLVIRDLRFTKTCVRCLSSSERSSVFYNSFYGQKVRLSELSFSVILLTLVYGAVVFIAAVFAVVLAVAAKRRRNALTVPALQQTLTLTSCKHTHVISDEL